MVDLDSLLGGSVESAERPKPLPVGGYTLQVTGHRFGESSKKKTPYVEFDHAIVGVDDDVDQDALAQVEEQKPLKDRVIQEQFYLTDNAKFILREYLEALGINIEGGRSFADCIPEAKGHTVKASVRHSVGNTGNEYAEWGGWSAVE